MSEDFYAILQVSPSAPASKIKDSYRKLALRLHPDRNKDPGATAAFQLLGKAWGTLKNETTRATYDRELRELESTRKKREAAETKRKKAEEERKRAEEERKKREQVERERLKAEEEKRKREEALRRQREAEERRKREEIERERVRAEEENKKREEAARRQREAEERRKREEAEREKKRAEEAARKLREEVARKQAEEIARKKREDAEIERRRSKARQQRRLEAVAREKTDTAEKKKLREVAATKVEDRQAEEKATYQASRGRDGWTLVEKSLGNVLYQYDKRNEALQWKAAVRLELKFRFKRWQTMREDYCIGLQFIEGIRKNQWSRKEALQIVNMIQRQRQYLEIRDMLNQVDPPPWAGIFLPQMYGQLLESAYRLRESGVLILGLPRLCDSFRDSLMSYYKRDSKLWEEEEEKSRAGRVREAFAFLESTDGHELHLSSTDRAKWLEMRKMQMTVWTSYSTVKGAKTFSISPEACLLSGPWHDTGVLQQVDGKHVCGRCNQPTITEFSFMKSGVSFRCPTCNVVLCGECFLDLKILRQYSASILDSSKPPFGTLLSFDKHHLPSF